MISKIMLGLLVVITLGMTLLTFPLQQQAIGANEALGDVHVLRRHL